MSYDLAVWEGDRPAADVAAEADFSRLHATYIAPDEPTPPPPRITAYVTALLERYPDSGTDGPWRFELTSARGHSFRDPDPEVLRKVLAKISPDHYFAVLTRADDWYIQVGYGQRAPVRPGWYALERRDGTPDRHYRAEVTNIEEVLQAFTGFLQDDPTLPNRFPWHPHTV